MRRISVVEALRGLASISVALFHFCGQLSSREAQVFTNYGWLGVDVFFVISGFVIPLSLYGKNYRIADFPSFMLRRMVRLEPPYLVSITLTLLLWHASTRIPGFAGQGPSYSFPQIAYHLFYLVPLTHYQWLSPVYWSLAYEFVFYITVGLVFSTLITRHVAVTFCFGFIVFGISFAVWDVPDVRIIEFVVGALLMRATVCERRNVEITLWLVASVVLTFIVGDVATGLIVSFVAASIFFMRDVDFGRFAIFLGSISYSLYLIHVPIGGRIVNLLKRFGQGLPYEIFITAAALLISAFAAVLFCRLVEGPSLAISRNIKILEKTFDI
ncbi:MAG TPA: acyltransferase [Xanthobacteraceae bacterium]|jgi:peptidoglycan/LPS O-acetylase OafA/YrhL|nr:acyltransferase [Xanthobacteraceae bacterium]